MGFILLAKEVFFASIKGKQFLRIYLLTCFLSRKKPYIKTWKIK